MKNPQQSVYFNHGKESGPWGSKITKLAEVARQNGFVVESIDYQDLPDASPRVERLLQSNAGSASGLILVGSSMGGYVATVARAVFTSGRRYEVFKTLEEFRAFHERAKRALALIEPVLPKHQLKVAIENHKDHTTEELVALMRGISSEWVGVLVDTGNNLALLEEPHGVIEALAPFALSVHLKDMAVQSSDNGFLLSEVPLGTGMLDLPRIIAMLRRYNPALVFNLEMATRDPLRIPCLNYGYFATFPERKATHLDAAMKLVKANPPKQPPPVVSGKATAQVLAEEETNNRHGLGWMQKQIRA